MCIRSLGDMALLGGRFPPALASFPREFEKRPPHEDSWFPPTACSAHHSGVGTGAGAAGVGAGVGAVVGAGVGAGRDIGAGVRVATGVVDGFVAGGSSFVHAIISVIIANATISTRRVALSVVFMIFSFFILGL